MASLIHQRQSIAKALGKGERDLGLDWNELIDRGRQLEHMPVAARNAILLAIAMGKHRIEDVIPVRESDLMSGTGGG